MVFLQVIDATEMNWSRVYWDCFLLIAATWWKIALTSAESLILSFQLRCEKTSWLVSCSRSTHFWFCLSQAHSIVKQAQLKTRFWAWFVSRAKLELGSAQNTWLYMYISVSTIINKSFIWAQSRITINFSVHKPQATHSNLCPTNSIRSFSFLKKETLFSVHFGAG